MKKFDLQAPKTQYSWVQAGVLFFLFLLLTGCGETTNLVVKHRFSNFVIDGDKLWFGAGYKLYRVDLNQKTAAIVYDTGDVPIFFVQIDETRLFFGGGRPWKKVLWALDLDKENILWSHEFSERLFSSSAHLSPPLINKEVLMISTLDELYAFDKTSGDIMWKIEGNGFYDFTPILSNEQLIYGVDRLGDGPQSNHTIAFADPYSGKTIRTISLPGLIGGTPAVHGNCLLVKDEGEPQGDNLRLNCIDMNTGEIVWFVRGSGYARESIISFYNEQVFDVFYDQLFAIDERSGELIWKSPHLEHESIINPHVIEEVGWIALETFDANKVIFLDLETGKQQDEVLLDVLSPPLLIGHEAIYGTTNAVVRIDIVTGETIWSIWLDSHYLIEQYNDWELK